ncbi:MAG TPA: hypothetical protein VI298_03460 [Geobacteraceae bacterium]
MKTIGRSIVLIILMVAFANGTAMATPTQLTVMVRAKDAKFIGDSMSGVLITIRNADTGELLAKGVTAGTTGDTENTMKKPRQRGAPLSDAKSARFNATIDISEPTFLEIHGYGPLAQRQSAGTVSVTQWVIPGKHVNSGDGILLEMPGFAVAILAPPPHLHLPTDELPAKIEVRANVIMMCGCPVTPGGLWDANRLEVRALVRKNGKPGGGFPLAYAGEPSQFAGSLAVSGEGVYEVTVYAHDPSNGNTGVDTTTVVVQ